MSRGLRAAAVAGVGALAVVLAGCGAGVYTPTAVPTPSTTTSAAGSGATATPASCTNATQSYDPVPSLDGAAAQDAVKAIRERGYLRAGVSADSWLLGSRNPVTGQIEGFDIDMVKAVAKAIFGDESKVQLVVIQSADRIPSLQRENDPVDIVARNMTMTCARWNDIAFSAEYYQSGLKLLVNRDSDVTSFAQLAGKKVCAPNGTSTMDQVKQAGVVAVGAATHTGCLVLFQQGEVDAIAGDDTVLAGLKAQDPYAKVPSMDPLTSEPYGIGIKKENVALARYVNRVLDDVKSSGAWKASYERWFSSLGPAPAPPPSVYGRVT